MYILQKIEHGVAIDISAHETLNRLADAIQHYTELHGVCSLTVRETDDAEDVCTMAVQAFDDDVNNTVAIEELSELQKEICKRMRGAENDDHMSEEIADAEIVIEKLKLRYGLRERVDEWRRRKVERLRKKIEGQAP